MNLMRMLPIPPGQKFSVWAEEWLKDVSTDLHSVTYDPNEVARRNERFGQYLTMLTTIATIYRQKARQVRDTYHATTPKPEKGVREWEERRDSLTAEYRYMEEYLTSLHDDVNERKSISQSNLGMAKAELRSTNGAV